jgi:hypothetical protein
MTTYNHDKLAETFDTFFDSGITFEDTDHLDYTRSDRYDFRSFQESLTVEDIVCKTPLSNFTSAKPWATSSDFDNLYHNPTFQDYWNDFVNSNGPVLKPKSDTENLVLTPSKETWVDIRYLRLNEEGGQRLQIRDPKEATLLKEHAVSFDYRMVTVKIARCNDNKEEFGELAGADFVYDGGGCCMKALLRGITHLPAQIVRVSSKQELRNLFHDENESVNKIKGVELFKKKLVDRDPFARLQDRVMERSGVTPVKHHTDSSLRLVELSAIKRLLEGKFKGITSTSWSGDPIEQVVNSDLFPKRKSPTVEFALDSLASVYKDSLTETSVVVASGQFKAVWNGLVPQAKFINMLEDYRDGKVKIKLSEIDESVKIEVPADFTTLAMLGHSLNLTRMQTEKHWGVVGLSILWNHWVKKSARRDVKKLDENHIKRMRIGEFIPYAHN